MLTFKKPFIIYEMANNHQGSIEHGKKIINELKKVSEGFDFDFAVKFQYRNLDTFIHPDFKDRMDLKFVKRFSDTRLSDDEFLELKKECEKIGFKTICTPFDEDSVDKIVQHKYDYIKVASCSVRDWPLLEEIAKQTLPIISSSGGATMEDMDKLVSFFEHKNRDYALMHCVGIYPTKNEMLQLNRIDWFKQRYPGITIGFSTHETPAELLPVSIAIAKGAMIFEKHVGVETGTIKLNDYSCNPSQVQAWLQTIEQSFAVCGVKSAKEHTIEQLELDGLKDLKRGVFAKNGIKKDDMFNDKNVFFAMPKEDEQMTSEEFSKHHLDFIAKEAYEALDAINSFEVKTKDIKAKIASLIHTVKSQLNQAKIVVNKDSNIELSHHYGIEQIEDFGAVLIDCINEEYCKKIIVLIPNQTHPEHLHIRKKESFQVLDGELYLSINGVENRYKAGDIVTIPENKKHSFRTVNGVVFEEVSTTHYKDDSLYSDAEINRLKKRKTNLKDWWLKF
jgi:sialic acid synthase SpsE/quercetin dioxygenase-like cupin family protein